MTGAENAEGGDRRAARGRRVLRVVYGSWLNLVGLGLLLLPDRLAGPRVAEVGRMGLRLSDAVGLASIAAWTLWFVWALAGDLSSTT